MSEPRRLRDGEGSDAARALLRGAAPSRPMRDDERRRALGRLPVAGAVAGAGLLASAKGLALTALAGAGVGVAITIVGPLASTWLDEREAARRAAPVASAQPARPAPPPADRAPDPARAASADAPAASAPGEAASAPSLPGQKMSDRPPSAPASAPDDAFAREVARLGQARAKLGPAPLQALADLDAMAAEFPAGKLGLERELLRVEALLGAGRVGEARTRALGLEPRVAGTPYEGRLERLLDRMP